MTHRCIITTIHDWLDQSASGQSLYHSREINLQNDGNQRQRRYYEWWQLDEWAIAESNFGNAEATIETMMFMGQEWSMNLWTIWYRLYCVQGQVKRRRRRASDGWLCLCQRLEIQTAERYPFFTPSDWGDPWQINGNWNKERVKVNFSKNNPLQLE